MTSTATRSLAVLRAALGDDIDLPTGDASDDEWAAALREFARAAYPAGSRPDSTIVVRAGRRRKTARRAAGTSAACAVVVALAFAMPPLVDRAGILATPPGATTSPTASAPPKQTPSSTPILSPTQSPAGPQRPVTVGSTQVATAGQDIQAVNLPTAVSATRMTAADVAGFDLTIDIADGFITLRGDGSHIGLPELSTKTTWIPAGPGDRNHAGSWMTAYGTSPLPTGPVAAALVAGEVPPWFGDPHVYILSNPSFALPDGTVPAIELPTFATPTGALAFAVVLRDDAARVFDSGSHGIVIQARDGTIVTPDCGPADGGECATQIPYVAIGQALAGPIGHLADDPVQPYAAPSPSTSSTSGALPSLRPGTMPSDERPAKAAPPTVTLAEGVAAANGLSSRAGDLGAVDPNVAGTYYLAGDLGGASVRIGVTSGAAPRLTIFGVTTYGVTTSPLAASGGDPFLTFAPIDASLSQVSAYFPYVGSPGFTAGITPAGSPRVFLVASWGFALADGSRVHALEVPTFAPPAAVAGPLTRDQRMWVLTDPGMAGGWGDGWSGYVFATADGTIVDPGCGDREAGSVDACTQEDLGWFGAFDEIRAMLAR